jgi:hypothetical protein
MEVHAHSHTERKKWTHYLWEFLMLFFAVFCGFLAENIREHSVERHREKEYITSLVNDLEYDTAQFNYQIDVLEKKIPFFDSVFLFLNNPDSFSNKLPVRYWINANSAIFYKPAEPTIQQLKSSGNLRLVGNKKVLDSILVYDSWIIGPYLDQVRLCVQFQNNILQFSGKVLDYHNFNQLLNENDPTKWDTNLGYSFILLSSDKEKLQEMYNQEVDFKVVSVFMNIALQEIRRKATNLITFIKNEYHLK